MLLKSSLANEEAAHQEPAGREAAERVGKRREKKLQQRYQVNGKAGSSVWEPFEDAWVGGARQSPVDNFLERLSSS
ncbi:unnamed protein product [Gadus morhua 'NCC']